MVWTPGGGGGLAHCACGLQNLDASLEALIAGEDAVLVSRCHRAEQDIDRTAFDSVTAAEVEEAGSFNKVGCCEGFIRKGCQRIFL